MTRRAFTIAAAISLLLAIVIAIIGYRSFYISDVVLYDTPASGPGGPHYKSFWVGFCRGEFICYFGDSYTNGLPVRHLGSRYRQWDPIDRKETNWLGFKFRTKDYFITYIPLWCPLLLMVLPPILWIRRFRRENRVGLCPICLYDLRATPTQCPECGCKPAS